MRKLLSGLSAALLALTALTPGVALAASPVTINNAANTSSACVTSGALCVTLAGTVLPQTGTNVAVTPTIQNASYASGNCMGGFQTVAMGTSASVLNAITLASKGGLATAKQLYLFSANPTGSTCTDKSTFTIAAADVSKVIATVSLTPTAPTGTTITFATAGSQGYGLPSGGTFYVAIVETATETPASTSDLVLTFSAF